MKDVAHKVVLITGGHSGLGKCMARLFSQLGAVLVLWGTNATQLRAAAEEISRETGNAVHWFAVDVTDRALVYRTAQAVQSKIGPVDILLNNAGLVSGKSIFDASYDDALAERVFAVNTTAHLWTIRAFVPEMMRRNEGHVVCVSSAGAMVGISGLAEYCASKSGAFGLNESLRRELKSRGCDGVHTTVVCPYFFNSGMFRGVQSRIIPIMDEKYVAECIVRAIREERQFLGLPRLIHYFPLFLNAVLPVDVLDKVYDLFGLSKAMHSFVGKAKI
uniref:Short-chain dehydrogenase/reductase 3 n=1 Tax=Arcella intermedia TaxID=1963864 RepID=A0A6B2LD97_9EUKA